MDLVTKMQRSETFEQMREHFPELDEPARRRAAARMAAGTEAQAAFAAESVMLQMVRVYN
ncbi:MAG TPA: hypothetical protein VKI99_00290 [Candidatus Dormibacteraeota bacterium]|nr:hypothetical protein [Candidatus Dormibacteraeota bacterium]